MNLTKELSLDDLTLATSGEGTSWNPICPNDPQECFYPIDICLLGLMALNRERTLLVVDYGYVRIIQPNPNHESVCIKLQGCPVTDDIKKWIIKNL